jgi:glycine/D-amino acid oxidase-like deaminating enzyme
MNVFMKNIIVIGAGVAGIGAAIELANKGHYVTLIERKVVGYGSSGRTPGRMGQGFHYADINTAKMYLRASIQVQRQYPDYLIGKDLPSNHPIRHGRYLITKDSDHPPEVILKTYRQLQEEYTRLVLEDPKNAVFGSPKSFIRILEPSEYENKINKDLVVAGVETNEHLFNFPAFLTDIKQALLKHPNINLLENSEVVEITRGSLNEPRFIVTVLTDLKNESSESTFQSDYLVNSTWENIEKLNRQVGIRMQPGSRTNRLKCLLIVKLPESLRDENSMFFCMGQHCMYSNLGDGYAMMTYAQVTNMDVSTDLDFSDETKRLLDNQATWDEKQKVGMQIIQGVSKYIPDMTQAEIIDVKYGVVQTAGALKLSDLKNPLSSFHKRDYDGIREEQLGMISNPCMKLFYFLHNSKTISTLLDAQFEVDLHLIQMWADVDRKLQESHTALSPDIRRSMHEYMDRYTGSSLQSEQRLAHSKSVYREIIQRKLLNKELEQRFKSKNNAEPSLEHLT